MSVGRPVNQAFDAGGRTIGLAHRGREALFAELSGNHY